MSTDHTSRRDPAIDADEMTEGERAALDAHERCMRFVNEAIAEGYDPRLLVEGLATTAASALVQTHGIAGAARILLACYAPIREAAVAAGAQVTAH